MVNRDVGLRWEVAINDVGYMLADDPDQDLTYRRLVSILEPERFSDGATPVSEAIERYSFFNSSEWRGGAGQRFLNRGQSDQSSYWDSEGVDPFNEDQRLRLLPDVDLKEASAVADCMVVAGSNYMLQREAATTVEAYTIAGDVSSADQSYTSLSNVTDMDIGYGKAFIANQTELIEVTLGSPGNTTLSTLDVHRVEWIGDRLAVIYRDSGSSTWRFSTLDTSGTEEITGGHYTLPGATNAAMASCEFKMGGITHGIGYCWFSGWTADGDESHIYVWNVDTTIAPSIAMTMPKGETALDVFFYQGGLYIYAIEPNDDVAKVYRGVVNGDGTVTPFLVVEDAGTATATVDRDGRKFAADGRYLFFAWNGMQTNSGFGVIDLATGGFAKRGHATASGDVVSVFHWGNRPGMSVASVGAELEHSSDKVTSGFLKTSIVDADSAVKKRWDSVYWDVTYEASTDFDVEYTTDGGATYTALISAEGTDTEGVATLGVEGASLGLKIDLNGSGNTPYIRVISAKFHPLGVLDQVLVLPINCSDQIRDLKGAVIQRPDDVGMAQARALDLFQGNWVTVQDVDYQKTAATYSYEVVQVDIRRFAQTYDPSQARGRSGLVAVVSLRRDIDITTATAPSNSAPVITDPTTQNDSVDVEITPLQLAATDADSDPLRWGASGLPTGLTISRSGLVSGTPTETGAFSVTFYANDGAAQDSQAVTWNIT